MQTIIDELFGTDVTSYAGSVSPLAIVFTILSVLALSLVILYTYKHSYQTTVYNRSFAISLPIVAMVTSVIIISVSSNIITAKSVETW